MDPSLRSAIVTAIGDTDRPIENRFEARRRARQAAEDAIAVLRSEGYYAYQVEPDVGDTDPATALVHISPGQRFVIAHPTLEWQGAPPERATMEAAQEALGLGPGRPGRAADVLAAEGRVVAVVQKHGYADVAAAPREVVVDHDDHTVQPTFHIAAGALARMDGIVLATNGRLQRTWLDRLAPWRSGDPYDPKYVAELERRLLDTGVFESVTVGLAPADQTTPQGLRPVQVSLAERRGRTLDLSASYATTEGAGVEAKWTRYNLLGRADTLTMLARVSELDSRIGPELSLPHWRRADQTLRLATSVYRLQTDAYDATGVGVQTDVTRHFTKTTYVTVGGSLDYSRTTQLLPETLTSLGQRVATAALLANLALDRSDDPLNPKRGWRANARVEPTVLTGHGTLPYLRMETQGSAYLPFGDKSQTVIAARLRLGAMFNGLIPEIPGPQRYYAGGAGSVRGFGYQDVGPKLSDGTPQGGLSLIETSLEVRHDIGPHWGVVAFVDAGAVGKKQVPDFQDLSIGAGLGVRYNLNFGPIRVDVGTPVSHREGSAPFQIYVSIGQSF